MRTEQKIGPIDLFAFLRSSDLYPKIYWASRGQNTAIAAVGQAAFSTCPRLFRTRHFMPMQAIEWRDFPPACAIHPRIELIRQGSTFLIAQNGDPIPFDPLSIQRHRIEPNAVRVLDKISSHSKKSWKHQIDMAINAIGQKQFEKVVLAKRIALHCSSNIDPISLCQSIARSDQTVFLFQPTPASAFLGATPEMLYRRKNRAVECDALAGTRLIERRDELLRSEKDIREFSIVQNHILEALSFLCREMERPTKRCIRTTPRLAHLSSQITGLLKDDVSDEMLIEALHPTPAVGGYPRKAALSFISATEPFARGLYAAPIGWTSDSESEMAVGIRSCLIHRSTAYLFAGTGIVDGSDPEKEWDESEHKLSQFTNLFCY
jgi:menaquinone-specific isochorismate synthase